MSSRTGLVVWFSLSLAAILVGAVDSRLASLTLVASGQTESPESFVLRVPLDGLARWKQPEATIRRCVRDAVTGIRGGNSSLVLDRCCGTSLALAVLLAAFVYLGAGVLVLAQCSLGAACITWFLGTLLVGPGSVGLGLLAQRYVTTSAAIGELDRLRVRRIENVSSFAVYRADLKWKRIQAST